MAELTPMMKQYMETKKQYNDCILFYRLGDFYEMFFDDALTASKELEITLTGRDCGLEERAPMCGVPFHAAQSYICKLISKGYKVAICEQLENPAEAKGIVKRDVIRVVTPGTITEANMLDEKKNNYIMSVYKKGTFFGLAVCDVSTGDFYASEIKETNNFERLLDEIARYLPAELIVNNLFFETKIEMDKIKERFNIFITNLSEEAFNENSEKLPENYTFINENDEKINNLDNNLFSSIAINGLVTYLTNTQKIKLEHINTIKIYNISKYMTLDINARRNLELTEKMRDKSKKGTLLWVLDKTCTSMGGRQLRRWINNPLLNKDEINERLEATNELKNNLILKGNIVELLKKIYDIERLIGKISYGNANARDMVSLKNSLKQLPYIKEILKETKSNLLNKIYTELDELKDIQELIEDSIVEEPPITIKEGGIIKLRF